MSTKSPILIFHIIYIRGTVRLFHRFVYSLLAHSNCHFCLVSNACFEEEKQILRKMCLAEERLSFCDLPTTENWLHGKALTFLYKRNNADFFCFMDSDIFATGPFMNQFQSYLSQYLSLSSCSSLWMLETDKILPVDAKRIKGRYNRTLSGINIGSSYFAIYNCKLIEQMITPQKVSFDRIHWKEVDVSVKEQLKEQALVYEVYDTAKLLNLSLYIQGGTSLFFESKHLIHLGATSSNVLLEGHFRKKKLVEFITPLTESYWKRLLLKLFGFSDGFKKIFYSGVEQKTYDCSVRKAIVSTYFLKLIDSLIFKQPLPSIPWLAPSEKEIQIRLEDAVRGLKDLFTHNY